MNINVLKFKAPGGRWDSFDVTSCLTAKQRRRYDAMLNRISEARKPRQVDVLEAAIRAIQQS